MPPRDVAARVDDEPVGGLPLPVHLGRMDQDAPRGAREGARQKRRSEDDDETKQEAPVPASPPGTKAQPGVAVQAAGQTCGRHRRLPTCFRGGAISDEKDEGRSGMFCSCESIKVKV